MIDGTSMKLRFFVLKIQVCHPLRLFFISSSCVSSVPFFPIFPRLWFGQVFVIMFHLFDFETARRASVVVLQGHW
jgi:hypothetical protein